MLAGNFFYYGQSGEVKLCIKWFSSETPQNFFTPPQKHFVKFSRGGNKIQKGYSQNNHSIVITALSWKNLENNSTLDESSEKFHSMLKGVKTWIPEVWSGGNMTPGLQFNIWRLKSVNHSPCDEPKHYLCAYVFFVTSWIWNLKQLI